MADPRPPVSSAPPDLAGRAILVTGASSGIGRACAIEAARQGATVALLGRDTARLEEARAACAAASGGSRYAVSDHAVTHCAVSLDLCDHPRLPDVLDTIVTRLGPLSGLVHAAGVSLTLPLATTTPADLDRLLAINVTAALHLTSLAVKRQHWVAEGGSIVFIASVMGIVGEAGKAAYACSKGAILAGARSLAVELAPRHIRVNAISPGVVQTPLLARAAYARAPESLAAVADRHLLGLGEPTDVAHAATFLLSDKARWITGTNLVVDGGYTSR
jgi:NAD(P)-dependent dehydrogenase (short-subunit alcohol dehydrogenase family)